MTDGTPKQYDVGILGWWYGKNYGSILTYYGLNRAITGLGHKVLMVNETLGYNGFRVTWPFDILSIKFAKRVGYDFTEQRHYSKMPQLNEQVETFVVGSDQLWNPLIGRVNDDLFLDFVGPENRRVAYATSFGNRGTSKFKPEFIAKHSENLKKFAAISVRESYAVDTARDVFGVEATQVVDPVFLLPTEDYEKLAQQATLKPSGDYLAVFFLDPTPEKRDAALAVADKLGLQKIVVIPNPDGGRKLARQLFSDDRCEVLGEDSPENFLYAYSKARYVVTDSFHGTAFSVIFGKPFSSIYNTHRGADRFKSLLTSLGFGESRRIFEDRIEETITNSPNVSFQIDFTKADAYIRDGRKMAMDWLKAALAPQSAEGRAFLSGLRDKYQSLVAPRSKGAATVEKPAFTSNNDVWQITPGAEATSLSVAPGGAVRGNLVWCDLPKVLRRQQGYRLTIRWQVRTKGRAINLHARNPETGKFRVIGTVPVAGKVNRWRTDSVDFVVPEDDLGEFMLGAVHFTGDGAGAVIGSLSLREIGTDQVNADKKAPSHAEQALALALKDNDRQLAAYTRSTTGNGITRARARMMFHAHAIEKGLSRSDFRAGFGKIAVPGLAREMNSWLAAGRDPEDQFFRAGASVMKVYFDRHNRVGVDVSEFRKLFQPAVLEKIAQAGPQDGGVLEAQALREALIEAGRAPEAGFLDIIYGRRSIREFTDAPVADEDIRRAVQIAMQAPSVCNRQAARVHQFRDPRAIKAALDLQGGFSGYKMPPRLLLVTCDLTAFLFATERNQAYIDGGLFMMTLLLGLQRVGLGSCSLNTAMGPERESQIRKILSIPEDEIFISFVATGHYDPKVLTPRSKRITVDEVLVSHEKT